MERSGVNVPSADRHLMLPPPLLLLLLLLPRPAHGATRFDDVRRSCPRGLAGTKCAHLAWPSCVVGPLRVDCEHMGPCACALECVADLRAPLADGLFCYDAANATSQAELAAGSVSRVYLDAHWKAVKEPSAGRRDRRELWAPNTSGCNHGRGCSERGYCSQEGTCQVCCVKTP